MILANTVVFITGGAQGFGKAVAEAVLKKGAKVCLGDINQKLGNRTAAELKSLYCPDRVMSVNCDVTNQAHFQGAFTSAVSRFGQVDIMCNNAGILDERIWEKAISVNLNGVVRGTNIAIDHMRTDKGGKGGMIINTSSTAALVTPYYSPVYTATKGAVYSFTNSWANNPDLKAAGVRFTVICPAASQTAMLQDLEEGQMHNIAAYKEARGQQGYCTADYVAEGFVKAMEDDEISGGAIVISLQDGIVHRRLVPEPVSVAPAPTKT